MSFSLDVKQEIMEKEVDESSMPALLCGVILSSGSLVLERSGITFLISSENSALLQFSKKLLKRYCPQVKLSESERQVNFKQKERIEIKVDNASGRIILSDLGILSFSKDGRFEINRLGAKHLTHEQPDKIAFLKGMFLGAGSVSIPQSIDISDIAKQVRNSGYHMEWNVQAKEQAEYIRELLAELDIIVRTVERNESYVVYLKEADSISSLLGIFGASRAVLTLENERAGREMRNLVNRQANCISANIDKSISAALVQLEAIEKIRKTVGLEALPPALEEVALARLANPEGSLSEICEVLDNKISKGAVSLRFKKIIEIAKEI